MACFLQWAEPNPAFHLEAATCSGDYGSIRAHILTKAGRFGVKHLKNTQAEFGTPGTSAKVAIRRFSGEAAKLEGYSIIVPFSFPAGLDTGSPARLTPTVRSRGRAWPLHTVSLDIWPPHAVSLDIWPPHTVADAVFGPGLPFRKLRNISISYLPHVNLWMHGGCSIWATGVHTYLSVIRIVNKIYIFALKLEYWPSETSSRGERPGENDRAKSPTPLLDLH